jgi:predicted cupin superfamily sugar epimerase
VSFRLDLNIRKTNKKWPIFVSVLAPILKNVFMPPIEKIIRHLKLQPHPEGGYYRETYRSAGEIGPDSLTADYQGKRNFSTCIYFLLTSENFSAFHRIKQDEIWHFYEGASLWLHMISPDGVYSKITIGRDLDNGEVPQFVVPGGYWFSAMVASQQSYTLLGCTVSPGFHFNDFELAPRNKMMANFPQHSSIITAMTRA